MRQLNELLPESEPIQLLPKFESIEVLKVSPKYCSPARYVPGYSRLVTSVDELRFNSRFEYSAGKYSIEL